MSGQRQRLRWSSMAFPSTGFHLLIARLTPSAEAPRRQRIALYLMNWLIARQRPIAKFATTMISGEGGHEVLCALESRSAAERVAEQFSSIVLPSEGWGSRRLFAFGRLEQEKIRGLLVGEPERS